MWISPVVLIASEVFVLSNILDYNLFVSTPANTTECYIALDFNNTFDNAWPEKWTRMILHENETTGIKCSIDLSQELSSPPEVMNFMVRFWTGDERMLGTENWQAILWSTYNNSKQENNNVEDNYTSNKTTSNIHEYNKTTNKISNETTENNETTNTSNESTENQLSKQESNDTLCPKLETKINYLIIAFIIATIFFIVHITYTYYVRSM